MFTKMKLALAATAALAVGGAGIVAAQGQRGSADHADFAAKRAEMKQKMLEKFDTNRDGKLDQNEKIAMRDSIAAMRFQKLDKDGNGVLSLDEFKAARAFGGKHHFRGRFGHHGKRGMGPGAQGGADSPDSE